MTLALLLTAATGAWAQSTFQVKELTADMVSGWTATDNTPFNLSDIPGFVQFISLDEAKAWADVPSSGRVSLIYKFKDGELYCVDFVNGQLDNPATSTLTAHKAAYNRIHGSAGPDWTFKIYYTTATPFAITWSAATPNTASIAAMPAGNVTVSVDYFAQAELAESGAPAAIADVPANTDEPIVTPGTVANIGTSEVKQGTLMYFVSQSTGETAPEAPDYDDDGWSEDVPTANGLAQGKAYVWYYIKGAEPDQVTDRTDDNTRNDSDIMPLGTTGFVTLDAEPTYDVSLNKTDLAEGEPAKWSAKSTNVAEVNLGTNDLKGVKKSETVTVTYTGSKKVIGVKAEKKAKAPTPTLAEATAEDYGKVVCAAGHLHDAKTAVPSGCTAVGILGKVTSTGHGLILALKNAEQQTWNTINGWTSASYAGTTLKVLPDDAARGTNLASYTTLGETTVSNWAVAQKSDYEAIFTNLGSTKNSGGKTYDNNVNAYIITGVGGTAMSGTYWSATQDDDYDAWYFLASYWDNDYKTYTYYVRPVLGF